jgi:hypothetical protein
VSFDGDVNADGSPDLAGDFDGNGVVDLGGPGTEIMFSGGSLGGIMTALFAGVEPAVTAAMPIVGGGGLSDVAGRTENGAVLPAMLLRIMGPIVASVPSDGPSDATSCAAGDYSLRIVATSLTQGRRTEFACLPAASLAEDDLLVVRNLSNGEVACAGTTGGQVGHFRLSVPSDAGDLWTVEHYAHGRDLIHYGECEWVGEEPEPTRVISTWEVSAGVGPGRCSTCATYETTRWEMGAPLVAPTAGFGRARQTPDFRRLAMLGQIALDPGDPINYARRVLLDPVRAPDVPDRPRSILVANTTGDPNVCIAVGYAYARAAGIIPFLPPDGPEHLADFRAPADFSTRYPGYTTPHDLLVAYHAMEAVPRLNRHPAGPGAEFFLADVDDLSDGRLFFATDGRTQLAEADGGFQPVRLDPPLRWVRQSRPMASPGEDSVWAYAAGEPMSGMANLYIIPRGAHGPTQVFDPSLLFDGGVYGFNMLGRYAGTRGTDIPYMSDPTGHHCLEDSTCTYLLP